MMSHYRGKHIVHIRKETDHFRCILHMLLHNRIFFLCKKALLFQDIFRDADILQKASEAASELLADDPYFEKPEHELLKKVMKSYLDLENHDIGL